MTDQPVVLKRENGVVVLTLNNPSLNVTTLTRVALPEIKLGVFPGGGTIRVTLALDISKAVPQETAITVVNDLSALPFVTEKPILISAATIAWRPLSCFVSASFQGRRRKKVPRT